MATRTHNLAYWVYLNDKEEVARQHGDTGDGTTGGTPGATVTQNVAPDVMATRYNAVRLLRTEIFKPGTACEVSDWFGSPENFPCDVASFERKSGGWFGIPWLFGDTDIFYWRAGFIYNPPIDPGQLNGNNTLPMPKRRWIDGFEVMLRGEGGSGDANVMFSVHPGASRHPGQRGFAIRNMQCYERHVHNEASGGARPTSAWERFYIRIRRCPTQAATVWRCYAYPVTNLGMGVQVGADKRLYVVAADGVGALSTLGSSTQTLELDTWYKVDVVYKVDDFFSMFINGVPAYSIAAGGMADSRGIRSATSWDNSRLGGLDSSGHKGSWDLDDWIGADMPTGFTSGSAGHPSIDWMHGSRVAVAQPTGYAADNTAGGFVPPGGDDAQNWRLLRNRDYTWTSSQGIASIAQSSSAASPKASVNVDVTRLFSLKGVMGYVAFLASCCTIRASTGNGKLSYALDGGADVDVNLTESDTQYVNFINRKFNTGAELTPFAAPTSLKVKYTGNADATSKTVTRLCAIFELLGDFHPEDRVKEKDDPADLVVGTPHLVGMEHNWSYEESAWCQPGPPPISPVITKGGTYVGNGKSVQLAFRAPVNLLVIRRAGNPQNAIWWTPGCGAPHCFGVEETPGLLNAKVDTSFVSAGLDQQSMQVIINLHGNHANVNENGATYNYFVMMDPGMRFLETGVFKEMAIGQSDEQQAMKWTADCLIATIGHNATSASGMFEAGQGCVAPAAMKAIANQAATAFTRGATGAVTIPDGSAMYYSSSGLSRLIEYAAIRLDDGSGDEGIPKLLNVTSYTGDGTAARTIGFSRVSGRRPMFAIVWGANGNTAFRDPSHTTTTSCTPPATINASTGITGGGIDSISVGSALNTNGVVYDVLVFWAADATAGESGWGVNGENYPIHPKTPASGPGTPWGTEPEIPTEPVDNGEEEPVPGTPESYDFSLDCIGPSTKIINLALSRIGISKQVGNILTESSAEATAGRLHFSDDVTATLRAFPWPFATRYAHLELVAGDASEQDTVQAWYNDRRYEVGDVVRVLGVDHYAIKAGTNHQVTNGTYWSSTAPEEVNGDWLYAYRVPDRYVFARRLVNPNKVRRDYDPDPPKFRLGSDENGLLIYTNELNAELEYTFRLSCSAGVSDGLFRSALAWRHAMSIAPSLSRDEKKADYCRQMFDREIRQAEAAAANEEQKAKDGDADWISAR